MNVDINDVRSAAERMKGQVAETPLVRSAVLSEFAGAEVYLKLENLLFPVGSFKLRGAFNKITTLTNEERERGIVAVSAGNHSQAVAYCCSMFGIDAAIFMPENSPKIKIEKTKRFGANVILKGKDYDDSERYSHEYERETGRTFIHPFYDEKIIAGQGTVGLEIVNKVPDVERLVLPVGGGGLICGTSISAKAHNSDIEITGVQPDASAPFVHSLEAGKNLKTPIGDSLADALTGEIISEGFFDFYRKHVDSMAIVNEEEIEEGIYWMLRNHAQVVEGGGAVGVSAIIKGKLDLAGKKTVVVITGCGVDLPVLARIIKKYD